MIQIKLPNLGDGVNEVTITRWHKKIGDAIKLHDVLVEVETDKITTEVVAEQAGQIAQITAREGDKVKVGTLLAELSDEGAPVVASIQQTAAPSPATQKYSGRVSPVVSRMVAEHGLNLDDIRGTGEHGRVTKQDVLAYLKSEETGVRSRESENKTLSPELRTPNSELGMQPLSTMRQRIAEHMVASKRTSPHVTTVFEFDFGRVAKHREAHKAEFARGGVNLTWLAYLTTATAQALRQHRAVNSEWAENAIRLKPEVNIGIAVALGDDGLVVPVIRNADELNLMGVARQIQDLAQRARNKQLQPSDMQGGTFTITNHGASGSLIGTPIINQPNAAILGFGAIEKRVKVIEVVGSDTIAIRPCAFVSLSFDHRILDGATADAFVVAIKRAIENW